MYADLPTPKQLSFITSLLKDRTVDDEQRADIEQGFVLNPSGYMDMTRGRASATIDWLLRQPRKAATPKLYQESELHAAFTAIPEGRYAVEIDGVLKFYRIDKPTDGRYAGRTFITAQGGPNWFPVKVLAHKVAVVEAILAAGPQGCSQRYGIELGHCGVCGLPLTDDESRARGIGPICWGKKGW